MIAATLKHIYINIARDWIGDTHTTYTLSTDKSQKVIRICNTASPCGQPILVKVGSILITLLQLGLSVISIIRPGLECVQ